MRTVFSTGLPADPLSRETCLSPSETRGGPFSRVGFRHRKLRRWCEFFSSPGASYAVLTGFPAAAGGHFFCFWYSQCMVFVSFGVVCGAPFGCGACLCWCILGWDAPRLPVVGSPAYLGVGELAVSRGGRGWGLRGVFCAVFWETTSSFERDPKTRISSARFKAFRNKVSVPPYRIAETWVPRSFFPLRLHTFLCRIQPPENGLFRSRYKRIFSSEILPHFA